MLVATGILSRFACAFPSQNEKPCRDSFESLKKVLLKRKPRKVFIDDGSEFKGAFKSYLGKENITITIAQNENIKGNYVEH